MAPTGKSPDVSWSRCGRINLVSTLSVCVCVLGILVTLRISPLCALAAQCPVQTSGASSPLHWATIEEAAQRSPSSLLGGGSTCWRSARLATRRPLASQNTENTAYVFGRDAQSLAIVGERVGSRLCTVKPSNDQMPRMMVLEAAAQE